MPLTTDQLKAMSFGYLTGGDLIKWCAPQNLIKQYEVDNDSLQDGCDIAYSEVSTKFATKYDLTAELELDGSVRPDPRIKSLVKIVTLLAVRNVLGGMQTLAEKMSDDFSANDKEILAIQRGLSNLPLPTQGNSVSNTSGGVKPSTGVMVNDSFQTLG